MSLKLSVLDQTPIRKGSNATETLQESIELARLADRLGYTRYWISEHHNTTMLAAAAPEVLLARLGAETKNIRLGSGGIMLPNHSSLKVAENFRLLEALYPSRIDLGIGRAPGGDRATSQLLNPSNQFDPKEYIQQIREISDFMTESPTPHNMNGKIVAIPSIDTSPALWILTSSGESAFLAAHFGIALSYAQFINPVGGPEAIRVYKEKFIPSNQLATPQTSVGLFVFCSESEEKVEQAKAMMNYRFLSFENGNYNKVFSYEDIKDYEYSAAEKQRLAYHRNRFKAGTPDVIEKELTTLAETFDTDEIVIATFADKKEDRLHSYELLATLMDAKKRDAKGALIVNDDKKC
ncbi:MAG: class flavin-dependent oxidoreductase [Chitinophagaceae bacterium]|nr:class flavin-dependent oxidoreductase [Chitinophagaceae bacterium]